MPSIYAHYRFGTEMLTQLPPDVQKTARRFRRLFDMGLHGPDIFFYASPLVKKGAGFLGIKFHGQTGKEFFHRVCRSVRMERSEASMAYLYGVLCHYCLDAAIHPYIAQRIADGKVSHMAIEAEFERFLLEMDGRVPPCAQNLTTHMGLSAGERETVAKFYPPAGPAHVKSSVRSMIFYTRLLAAPDGIRRKIVKAGMGLVAKNVSQILIPVKPNPACVADHGPMLALYREAQEAVPQMLAQIQAHMARSIPLGPEFDRKFG